MSSPLQDSAMLATLTVSQWTARKLDRKATREVNQAHGAKDAGRFNKLLIDAEALKPLQQTEGAARQYHYSVTLPWGNQGERLLPAALFMEYSAEMGKFKREFETRADELAAAYPQLVQDARVTCGSLYDPSDYPAKIRDRFSFTVGFGPVASADDFRVNLSTEFVNQIKQDILQAQTSRQAEAAKHVWERVREVVENIHETCSKDKPRIYESMIEKAEHLVRVLPALNINNDPELTRIAEEMQHLIVPTQTLKDSPTRRRAVAQTADSILAKLGYACA